MPWVYAPTEGIEAHMIDLRSDTVTTPDEEMRTAMAEAEVGDDVYREDPTINRLEERVSDILGTEAALFCPTGTMANQIALDVWTTPGGELILEAQSHILSYEVGGAARFAGLQTRPVDGGTRGAVSPETVANALRTESLHVAGTGLLALENTHNSRGGRALTVRELSGPAEVAHEHDVPVHLDGARLWNASVATGDELTSYMAAVDSVMVSLSKGLGAPVGSMLAGPADFIEQARRSRKAFGGGMRQAGILAAAGLVAVERRDSLGRDHRLASQLAAGISDIEAVHVVDPETNIILVHLEGISSTAWIEENHVHGVACSDIGDNSVRYVTHRDVSEADIEQAIDGIRSAAESL